MRLWLTEDQAQDIARQAQEGSPQEVCGLIAGTGERVLEIIPVKNIAADPLHHYYLDERAFTAAMFTLHAQGLSLIGIYHSHPNGDPIPSHTDVQRAYYPDTAYVIVGLKNNEPRLAAWNIRYQRASPVDLDIGNYVPEQEPADESLSQAQKTAIIVGALLAFAFMLVLSLSLLPPAPIIVTPIP